MGTENGTSLQEHKSNRLIVHDDGQFAVLLDTAKFEHMWRIATMFAKTELIPKHFQNKPEDTFIVCQMAIRCGIDPMTMLQNTYIVHGRPGIESKLAIALVNTSGLFEDSLDYEIEGDDPSNKGYRVRCYAVRKSTGKRVEGPWIDWALVKAEGWDSKQGSKWKTMPALMFQYRAAMFFARLHCPERLLGMQTADELEDVEANREPKRVEAIEQPAKLPTGKQSLKKEPAKEPETKETKPDPKNGKPDEDADRSWIPDFMDDMKTRIDEAKTEIELKAIQSEYASMKDLGMDLIDELDALCNEIAKEKGF